MSALGSLYIKLGEPAGELCGCTCEVGDWAADYIVDLTKQRDKLLAALEAARSTLDDVQGNINPERGYADELETDVSRALGITLAAIAEVKGQQL